LRYTALRESTVLLNESLNVAPTPPTQPRIEIAQEYAETERYLREAAPESRAFYNVVLSKMREEIGRVLGVVDTGELEE
jgi:hypothetical protein